MILCQNLKLVLVALEPLTYFLFLASLSMMDDMGPRGSGVLCGHQLLLGEGRCGHRGHGHQGRGLADAPPGLCARKQPVPLISLMGQPTGFDLLKTTFAFVKGKLFKKSYFAVSRACPQNV